MEACSVASGVVGVMHVLWGVCQGGRSAFLTVNLRKKKLHNTTKTKKSFLFEIFSKFHMNARSKIFNICTIIYYHFCSGIE